MLSRIHIFSPREVVQLKNALYAVEKLQNTMREAGHPALGALGEQLDLCLEVRDKIAREIYPDPANQIQKGGVIASGVNLELDDLRNISSNAKDILASIQPVSYTHLDVYKRQLCLRFSGVFLFR